MGILMPIGRCLPREQRPGSSDKNSATYWSKTHNYGIHSLFSVFHDNLMNIYNALQWITYKQSQCMGSLTTRFKTKALTPPTHASSKYAGKAQNAIARISLTHTKDKIIRVSNLRPRPHTRCDENIFMTMLMAHKLWEKTDHRRT